MNGPKLTNPGWPDPNLWVQKLYDVLAERQGIYELEPDVLLKRNKAAAMLGQVISSLLELPPFASGTAHLPLKDLMIFLSDLDRGRDHPWSAPVNFGGTSVTTTARAELKIWVRAAFAVLIDNGFKPVEAYRHIASGLTKSGRKSQSGGDIPWRRVMAWCREPATQRDQDIRDRIHRWWGQFRSETAAYKIVDRAGQPLREKQVAGHFADAVWPLPHLRDRSISGASE